MANNNKYKIQNGLSAEIVDQISRYKREPKWMKDFRQNSYQIFLNKPLPKWADGELKKMISQIDTSAIKYFIPSADQPQNSWDEVPKEIKNTFEALGIPEAERKFFGGATAQFESEVVYHHTKDYLAKLGVIFTDMDSALKLYPDLVKKYFATVIPPSDNQFSALNSAVWSGGSFIYIPPKVKVDMPLQAYFRINSPSFGQFERTLIIADEGSEVHYIEGCTAPVYTSYSLHAAVVEIVALPNSRVRYTTVQNWSKNIYNLVTKRAFVHKNAFVEWIDGNLGSCLTMKYPSVYLLGEGAKGDILSIALAGKNQHQDSGAKAIHLASNTSSTIVSKSISKDGGVTSFRGLVKVGRGQTNVKNRVRCDALILDGKSVANSYPTIQVADNSAKIEHEAAVNKISSRQLNYLRSKGLSENEAVSLIVNGFLSDFTKELPFEYAIELNRLITLEMEGAIG